MKKNVIILHTDQQRYDSLGCNGNQHARTEHIDSLAEDGCRFTRHIAANTTCMPSRASLLTGLYVPGHGVCSNGIPLWRRTREDDPISDKRSMKLFGEKVQDKIPTMADKLGDWGYQTALFGKIHVQPHLAPKGYGFYESYSGWHQEDIVDDENSYYGFQTKKLILGHGEQTCQYSCGHYGRWLHQQHPEMAAYITSDTAKTVLPHIRKDIYLSKLPSALHNTMWLADEVCAFMDQDKADDKPLFMFVGFPDPHHPFTPPEDISQDFMTMPLPAFASREHMKGEKPSKVRKTMEASQTSKENCAMAYRHTMASIYLIDQAIGKIINHLKEKGLYEDTIIVFTSDHGDYLGDFDMLMKNDIAFHNLLHLPFIVKGTKDMNLPSIKHTPMSNADVMPTLLSMLGMDTDSYIQGVDIFDQANEDNTPMVTCFGVTTEYRNISLYDDTYRYTYYLETKEEELYDHTTDIQELNNLVNDPDVDVTEICKTFRGKLLEKHVESDLGIYHHYALW
ncbi:sulfatase-like hydrolase/transferase [Vallitalea pronyensis]|uniref:Sulfatase-like hydrolase/transferase n=1 Tax=Vallitalea pronyensis TaxID=1348613 RepID=A0A8J8SGB3_9FIRM|nr:sulfatase-like hydrolase/transferase [Vallitalea pronyensis]QUI22214.1 sulfatase-like hydrolase/transferase [Vallitalea pronyensis]